VPYCQNTLLHCFFGDFAHIFVIESVGFLVLMTKFVALNFYIRFCYQGKL